MNDKKIGLLNISNHETYLKEQESIKARILTWKNKYPAINQSIKKLTKEELINYLIDIYLEPMTQEAEATNSSDKAISKCIAHLELIDVLMGKKTVEDKLAALTDWESTVLEIAGNNSVEAFKAGRAAGATKVRIKENPKIEAFKIRDSNLEKGRAKGSQAQKEYADETKKLIETLNSDLLKHPISARWKLGERAEYIKKKLIEMDRKQTNGKPYKTSTIKLFITGKG